jgi:photosystem II stability/assembly factor-like uncharacterized protein
VSVVALALGLALPGVAAAVPSGGDRHGQTARPTSGVPKNFKAQSMSWLSAKHAWVLGTGKCSPKPCSDVVVTTDGGATWNSVGSLPVPIEKAGSGKAVGVTEIRMATTTVGWAFNPVLAQTTDGGQTWVRVALPVPGKQVLSLDTNAHGAYLVMSSCKFGQGFCKKPLTFWHLSLAGDWTQISLDLPVNVSADVETYGKAVYVVDNTLFTGGDQDKLYASADGKTFESRPSPCDHTQDLALYQVVPTSATDVSELCIGDPGMSKAIKTVYRSTDTGKTTTSAGQAGIYGIQSALAVSPTGNLAMSSQSDGSFIYVNNTGGTTWTMPVGIGDGGLGWNDIVYTTGKVAWVVYAPAGGFEPQGTLYVTRDAGNTWAPAPF